MNKYLKSLLVILYYFVYNIIIYVPFFILKIDLENIPIILFDAYSICAYIILFTSLLYIYKEDFKIYYNDFKINGKRHLKLGFDYWIIGVLIMIISNIIIGSLTPIAIPENEQAIREAIKLSPFFIVFSSVINAPFVEEILFRKTLFDIFKNKNLFIITSGLIFGAFHIIGIGTTIFSWLYIIPYAALGSAFAYVYTKTNNLLTPICMHAFHNFITITQMLLFL